MYVNQRWAGGGKNWSPKNDYGDVTVNKIIADGNVHLNGTTVKGPVKTSGNALIEKATCYGKVKVSGNATIKDSTCSEKVEVSGNAIIEKATCSGKVKVSGNATIKDSTCSEKVEVSGNATINDSTCSKKVKTTGGITAKSCKHLDILEAGGKVDIDNCDEISSINAGDFVKLHNSKVKEDVSSDGDADIQGSIIEGTLSYCSDDSVIKDSIINTIFVHRSGDISIKPGSSTYDPGKFTIHYSNPENVVIDGVPLSELLSQKPSEKEGKQEGPKQVLELQNCKVTNVIFEGGNGEIVLSGESELSGEITGGNVRGKG